MKRFLSGICAAALAASFSVAAVASSSAAPVFVPQSDGVSNDAVVKAGWRQRQRARHFRRHNGRVFFNGHRGFRHHRRGYREYNGFWFPLAAFATGAIISGAIADSYAPRRIYRGNSAHVSWCYDRYRSYRAYDNTFQPYHGPRRPCYSPYD